VDVRPSGAQQLLTATAREFLRRRCPIELAQRLALDARGFDDALWRESAELGWPGLLVPPELGGSGGSLLDVVLLVEEMGRAALPGPYVGSAVVATALLLAAASKEQRARVLPPLAAGDRIATVALVEESGSFDPAEVALAVDGAGRLTGRKLFVKDAHVAHDLVVVARSAGELACALLPADRPGIARLPLDTMSGDKLFEVTFDGVEIRERDWLAERGRHPLDTALRAGALARAAEMVGAAQRVLELTVEHVKTRVQGGRPIGGFQAVQHSCADLVRDVDASRALVHVAAWTASEGLAAEAEIATAKAYAGEACLAAVRRGHQLFGAIAYCEEHPMHLLHKRIHAASLDCGDAALHLETVARAIGLEA
jgi:alkylation response protein AidB-like acyl-CoA dehydrogenase